VTSRNRSLAFARQPREIEHINNRLTDFSLGGARRVVPNQPSSICTLMISSLFTMGAVPTAQRRDVLRTRSLATAVFVALAAASVLSSVGDALSLLSSRRPFCRRHRPTASSPSSSTSSSSGPSWALPSTTIAADSGPSGTASYKAPAEEINRRRNLAIISHPDSGKTTMTEKLLLYGGALQQAGAVRQKAEQRATQSDFMEMEKERGISISSTVMNFEYEGFGIRLMDTPGHQDFSEDTYRALAAADNALMLLDGAKGLEPQTRKLFEVCRMRRLPLFTFVNKLDRPALDPYSIMDEIQEEFGLETYPILWPIGDGDRFKVLHRCLLSV